MSIKSKILVVDDDEVNVNLLIDILADDFIVSTASTGEEALEVVEKFNPDLILLDIMMPGIDGFEVCKTIKGIDSLKFIKIILVSVKSKLEERLKGYSSGADDYIVKPFDDAEVLAKIKVFLKLKYSEEVNVLKNNLISLFSHEANTPLNGILGFAQLLSESENLSFEEKEWVQLLLKSGERLESFVKKTIMLCQLKKGSIFYLAENSIDDLLSDIINTKRKSGRNKCLTIDYETMSGVNIIIDKKFISIVISYILDNAIKFANESSSITVSCKKADKNLLISIENKGKSIKEEELENIFSEFYYADIVGHSEGQGLSLSIAKLIMDAHKGEIYAKNLVDGVAFYLEIPC